MSTKDKETALAYKQMFELNAWKDFESFLKDERKEAIDKILISDDLKDIHTARGKLLCLDSIESHLDFVTK